MNFNNIKEGRLKFSLYFTNNDGDPSLWIYRPFLEKFRYFFYHVIEDKSDSLNKNIVPYYAETFIISTLISNLEKLAKNIFDKQVFVSVDHHSEFLSCASHRRGGDWMRTIQYREYYSVHFNEDWLLISYKKHIDRAYRQIWANCAETYDSDDCPDGSEFTFKRLGLKKEVGDLIKRYVIKDLARLYGIIKDRREYQNYSHRKMTKSDKISHLAAENKRLKELMKGLSPEQK